MNKLNVQGNPDQIRHAEDNEINSSAIPMRSVVLHSKGFVYSNTKPTLGTPISS
jgi:hypothetical protein